MLCDEHKLNSWYEIRKFIDKNEEFYVFGSGSAGEATASFIMSNGKKVIAFLDNFKSNSYLGNIPIFKPDILKERYRKILIASGWYIEIAHQLIKEYKLNIFHDFSPFYAYDWFMSSIHCGREFYLMIRNNRKKVEFIYNNLYDDSSRETYIKLLKYRSLFLNPDMIGANDLPQKYSYEKVRKFLDNRRDASNLVKLYKSRKSYLHPAIDYQNKRCILDIGAFVGDTAILFHELSPHAMIFALEPVSINYYTLQRNVKNFDRITPVRLGAWRENTTALFYINEKNPRTNSPFGYATTKKEQVDLVSIDYFVEKEKIQPDLIKIEVEGAEQEVLEGAVNTIQEFRPDLIIPIYHKGTDLIDIPVWLIERFPFYRYYIYHTEVFISSTVLIATAKNQNRR